MLVGEFDYSMAFAWVSVLWLPRVAARYISMAVTPQPSRNQEICVPVGRLRMLLPLMLTAHCSTLRMNEHCKTKIWWRIFYIVPNSPDGTSFIGFFSDRPLYGKAKGNITDKLRCSFRMTRGRP